MNTEKEQSAIESMSRRTAFSWIARGSVAGAVALTATTPASAKVQSAAEALEPSGATSLRALGQRLAAAPRRRDYKRVPMILTDRNDWDHEALDAVIHYRGGPKQVWDNTDIDSPWLNLMRNSMNAQVFSFRNPNFLAVSANHGTCHLALYDEYIWEKYYLAGFVDNKFKSNTFLERPAGLKGAGVGEINDQQGTYSSHANSIPVLMERGVVFMGCHNAIWEFSDALLKKNINPDHLDHERLAAELTNHLIPGAILTPGIVGTIPQLQQAGFHYMK